MAQFVKNNERNNIQGQNNNYLLAQSNMQSMPVRSDYGGYNYAYTPNFPMVPPTDFRNHNQVLHQNITKNVLQEEIIEYAIIIDSADRDCNLYPNPYEYKVTINPRTVSYKINELVDQS